MSELLLEAKERLIAEAGEVTDADFEREWDGAWETMVAERAWPHASIHRRQWRAAMIATKSEARAAFVGRETNFSRVAQALLAAAPGVDVQITYKELPVVMAGAIRAGYGATGAEERALHA